MYYILSKKRVNLDYNHISIKKNKNSNFNNNLKNDLDL